MEYFTTFSDSIDFKNRMDFNFWAPRQTEQMEVGYEAIKSCLGSNCLTTSAFYPSITPYYQSINDNKGDLIPFIRVGDARKALLDFEDTIFLNSELLEIYKKNIKQVNPGDIVITKGGEYIGEAALIPDYYDNYAICRDLLAIFVNTPTNKYKLSGAYIASFLQSKYGKAELIRTKSVQGQPHLTLEKIYNIKLPIFDTSVQAEIDEYYETFYELVNESQQHLATAQKMLNKALNGRLFQTVNSDIFTVSLTNTELISRCDCEYYEKRWDNLISTLKLDGIEFHSIYFSKENINLDEPTKVYNYITLADINERSGIITNYNELFTHQLPDRAKRAVKYGDVLVSSLKGSKNKVGLIEQSAPDDLVASTGFYVIRDSILCPEVIYLIFRSLYYTLFIEQMASGAIMSSITEKYFKRMLLPNLSPDDQKNIAIEIQHYLSKRQDAFDNLVNAISKFEN